MQFLTSLVGADGNDVVTSVLALGIVLVLIVSGLWVLKFVMKTAPMAPRSRRLMVVDQLQVDARRRLLIIRRDNVEHLILTGGPQDLLVEDGIPVEKQAAPARRTMPAEQPDELPSAETEEAMPAAKPRAARPNMDRLREIARPAPAPMRKGVSLRHTGLLRPLSVHEPAVIPMPAPIAGDNSGRARLDSATRPTGTDGNGRSALGAARRQGDLGSSE